jgi:hypothetical protein
MVQTQHEIVITSVGLACGTPMEVKSFSPVILSERSESKDPYIAHSLSSGTFFDVAQRGSCFCRCNERWLETKQISHRLKAVRDDNSKI